MHWGYYGMGMGGWMMILWVIIGLILIGVVIRAISRAAPPQQLRGDTPEDILRQRYAHGEVTREQFEQMQSDLRR